MHHYDSFNRHFDNLASLHSRYPIYSILLGFLLTFFTIRLNFEHITYFFSGNTHNSYGSFLVLSGFVGFAGIYVCCFLFNNLLMFFHAGFNFVSELISNEFKGFKLSFKSSALFNITFLNGHFHCFVLVIGYFVSKKEHYIFIQNIEMYKGFKNIVFAYFVSLTRSFLFSFFLCLTIVSLIYFSLCKFQHLIINNMTIKSDSKEKLNHFAKQFALLKYSFKKSFSNKKIMMISFGFVPSTLLVSSYIISLFTVSFPWLPVLLFSFVFASLLYPIYSFVEGIKEYTNTIKNEKSDNKKIEKKKELNDATNPIYIGQYIDEDIKEIIVKINAIIANINPYLHLVEFETAHVLHRITNIEVKQLVEHFTKLPADTQSSIKEELLQRLTLIKKKSEVIYQEAYRYHLQEFSKHSDLVKERYETS